MPRSRCPFRIIPVLAAAALGIVISVSHSYAQAVLVSTASDGTPGNGQAGASALDDSGRYVVFADASTNLVTGDGNGAIDVFVKDRVSNATTRVSVRSDGTERTGDSGSAGVDISGDGQIVVFTSKAALVANDTNTCGSPAGPCQDIYVHDRGTGQTTRVSVATDGAQANGPSELPSISGNGRYVTFTSHATNLVAAADTNGASDIFVHDRETGTTTRVSVTTEGAQGGAGQHSTASRFNADGSIVTFLSSAALTAEPDPFDCPVSGACNRAYVHDRTSGTTVRVPMALETVFLAFAPGSPFTRGVTVDQMQLDASGRWIALIVNVTDSGTTNVSLLYDRVAGKTILVDALSQFSFSPSFLALSGDGTTVMSALYLYGRVGYNNVSLDRTTGYRAEALSSPHLARELSFTGDIGLVYTGQSGVLVFDYDKDDDQMDDAWETAFGLDAAVADGALDPDGDGLTNLQEHDGGSHPRGLFKRYLAEGAVNAFFTTQLALVNPNAQPATFVLRFLGTSGLHSSRGGVIVQNRRETVRLTELSNIPENDFSTVIESDQPLVVDRTMTWDHTTYGGHAETSLEAPATTWYLAEGATHGTFSLFYLLQNPNDTDASVTVNYLRLAPETPVVKTYTVPANSRLTIPVDTEGPELEATDVAARIESNVPIIAERAMYSTGQGQQPFAAGHGGAGVTATALRWFLAEGATGPFFDLYVLVANPNPVASELQVTYLFESGEPLVKTYTAGANNRLTISVDGEDPRLENTPVSIIVESTNNQPVVVERSMWWPSPNWYEAHLSAGTTSTGTKWALADGEVYFGANPVDTYILIANTGATDGTATVKFLVESGLSPIQITVPVAANSRTNVQASTVSGLLGRFGTIVESDGVPIVVERAMYQSTNGLTWSVGTSAVATKLP